MIKKLMGIYEHKIWPRRKVILSGAIIFFVVFSVLGFFVLPPVLKSVLLKELSKNLHREVTINQIRVNPYTLSLTLRGLTIKDRASAVTFVSCDEIFLNLQSLSALRMALILKEIRLKKPYVRVVRNQDLSYNFSDLLEKKQTAAPEKTKPKPLRFSLNNIIIENGGIDFIDAPKQTRHTIRELDVGVPFLSNIPSYVERFVRPHFSARINNTLYTLQGKTKPFAHSLETFFDINIKGLDIPYYLAYVPLKLNFKVTSAYLDTDARISFLETKAKGPSLTITGNVSLKQIALNDDNNKPLFSLPLLNVSIAPSEPISKIIHLSKVSFQSPQFEIRRDRKGVLNTQSLLPEENKKSKTKPEPTPQKTEGSSAFVLDIDEIRLTEGKVSFSDLSGSKPFTTILDPIELRVDRFSNRKDKKSVYTLSLKTEAGETVKVNGGFSLNSLESEGTLEITSVPLKKYSPFYRDDILFDIEGRLDLGTRYRYAKGEKEPEMSLSGISLTLTDLRLKRTGESDNFAKIPQFSIKETDLNLTKRELAIGGISTEKGELVVKRSHDGNMNLLGLVRPASTSAPEGPSGDLKTGDVTVLPEKPWRISLKQASVDKYTIRMEDQTTSVPVILTAQDLKLRGENISTAKQSKGRLVASVVLNGKGTISTTGTIALEPLSADLQVQVRGIEIAPFQPYFTSKVRVNVTGGTISTTGKLALTSAEKKEMKVIYEGGVSVANFSSIDKVSGEDILKVESLSLDGLNAAYNPLSIDLKGVSLANFYARVMVSPEGKINLQEMFAAGEPKTEVKPGPTLQEPKAGLPAEKEGSSKNIRINQVTLQGGKIDFIDKSVKPEFSTNLSEMTGRVSGLSAEANTTADVELLAKLNDYAPLEITGKINPLSDNFFVDLKARIKDLDLSPASPYSGKYAGYTIEKGKLSFDLKYVIVNRKLNSQNNIFIDQFTFGEKVNSPQATSLPVRLAVALLKDRNGEIKLDLPVTGSLDDPKFSVWKIILKILVNLIAKAATSPFALLGAVFGGGEELSYVEFDYGSTVITEPNMKKLDVVSRALHDRPSLRMDIEGHVDMEKDKEGLKQLFFSRKLKAQKLNELVKKVQPAVPVDDIKIEPPEYEKYLKMAYKKEKFPKPKNFLGLTKDIPVPEMEKLMLTHTEVKEGDLRTLASQRAMKVKDTILKSGQIEPERIFMLEPKSLAPEKKEKVKDSRVDFKLK